MGCNCNNFVVPTPNQMIKGAQGLSKLVMGKNNTDEVTIQLRRDVCRNCEFSTKNQSLLTSPCKGLTAYSQCEKCACFIKYKTMLTTEQCPLNKWGVV